MNVGSLFTGIGGLDLGLECAGMTVVWQSEIDPYASRVLAKHWPTVPNLGDITAIDWSTVERPDLICGGYPCQPFSLAGARGGEGDARHLWPHFRDAVRHLRPRWALLENVPGHLSLGFGRVLGDLAELGYDTEWDCIPAAAVGAPHLRYRVFVVAHTDEPQRQPDPVAGDGSALPSPEPVRVVHRGDGRRDVPHTDLDTVRQQPVGVGRGGGQAVARHDGTDRDVADADRTGQTNVQGCQTVAQLAGWRTPDGAGWWDVEPDVGRVAHGIPARMDRLRTLGNAVVPQVAEWIGQRIMDAAS